MQEQRVDNSANFVAFIMIKLSTIFKYSKCNSKGHNNVQLCPVAVSIVDSLPSKGKIMYQVPGGIQLRQWCHSSSAVWSIFDAPLILSTLRILVVLDLLDCEGSVAYLLLDSVTLFDRLIIVFPSNKIIPVLRFGIIATT